MKLAWKPNTNKYQTGERLILGTIVVGGITWFPIERNDPPWKVYLGLPGVKRIDLRFESDVEAKTYLEKLLKLWLEKATLAEGSADD